MIHRWQMPISMCYLARPSDAPAPGTGRHPQVMRALHDSLSNLKDVLALVNTDVVPKGHQQDVAKD